MNAYQQLQKKAIEHAKNGDWQTASEINQQILEQFPNDTSALNRLGFCFLQLNKKQNAQETYQKVLDIEKMNPIAKKYLGLIKQNVKISRQQSSVFDDFVEEPRRTKIVGLDRLADHKVLSKLSVASVCTLKTKGRYVSVLNDEGEYIGSLPEDISFHLATLLKTGNEYACLIRSVSKQECVVFIKEKKVAPENKHIPSFFVQSKSSQQEGDEDVVLPDIIDQESGIDVEKEVEAEEENEEEGMNEQLPPDILGKVMDE